MTSRHLYCALAMIASALTCKVACAVPADPRLKQIWYSASTVVEVPVKRGTVTHIELDTDEAITAVATGLGADCAKPESSWCIAAQPGDRNIFIKPRSEASTPNNLAIVTNRRTHAFRLTVLPAGDKRQPLYRLVVRSVAQRPAVAASAAAPQMPMAALPPLPVPPPIDEAAVVAERLSAAPAVLNTDYSIANDEASADIVPTLVFDDGRFTYLRFPNNREVPAVFHVLGDGAETLVNTRMEGDLLVVDRVSRRLMLRAGSAVVGLWNEAFDLDGVAPHDGTTVDGVQRVMRAGRRPPAQAGRNPPEPIAEGER